jgi:hypothetical protein
MQRAAVVVLAVPSRLARVVRQLVEMEAQTTRPQVQEQPIGEQAVVAAVLTLTPAATAAQAVPA